MNELRMQLIVNYINGRIYATHKELCEQFHVSSATIRRDLTFLEEQGQIIRTHGGARCLKENVTDQPIDLMINRAEKDREEKLRIARKAVEFINDGETVLIDFSTTAEAIVDLLVSENRRVTVVSTDMNIIKKASEASNIDVFVIGGNLRKEGMFTFGPVTEKAFKDIYVNKSFIGFDSIEPDRGITMRTYYSLPIKQLEISCANQCFAIGATPKFKLRSLYQVCPLSSIYKIITCDLSEDVLNNFSQYRNKIIIAD